MFFAIISTTVALIAVFMPIIFLQGLTGRLFKEFGIVVGGAVAISAFVALTLTPMLSTHVIKSHQKHSWFYRKTEPFFAALAAGYRRSLDAFMQRRWVGLALIVVAGAIGFIVGRKDWRRRKAPILEELRRIRAELTREESEPSDGSKDVD